jgi:hypothetical protein
MMSDRPFNPGVGFKASSPHMVGAFSAVENCFSFLLFSPLIRRHIFHFFLILEKISQGPLPLDHLRRSGSSFL